MATINLNMLVKSVNTSSNVLSLYGQDILTVEEPLEDTSKASVDTVSPLTIVSNTAAKDAYVYIKNTDATNFVTLRTASGSAPFASLEPGEVCFFTALASVGLELIADTAACIVEYGYWTKT